MKNYITASHIAPLWAMMLMVAGTLISHAGNYSLALDDSDNPHDAPVPGFVGPHGEGKARILMSGGSYQNPGNFVNPLFFGWANGVNRYEPTPDVAPGWSDATAAIGPVTGEHFNVVSLGDLDAAQIMSGAAPGSITLTFPDPIRNRTGADFVVYENAYLSAGGAGVNGQVFAELAYVEVSSDGVHFARFSSESLTPGPVGSYGTVNASNVFNLAGKHVNSYGSSWGTPFDLEQLSVDPLVTGGQVDVDEITHIRIVDIPGNGSFLDSEGRQIYDAWLTIGSGGFDLEAVGVISRDMNFDLWQDQRGLTGSQRGEEADPNGNGISNLMEYATGRLPLANDGSSAATYEYDDGRLALSFVRDERVADLTYQVEVSDDLDEWTVIAVSSAGGPFSGVNGFAPLISESSASRIASVGVLREVTVDDVETSSTSRFMRLNVIRTP